MESSTTSSRVIGQVYPWDLADCPSRASMLRDAGVTDVAIAAGYHAVRAVRWTDDLAPVVVHEVASSYYPRIDPSRWNGPLRPTRSQQIPEGTYDRASRSAQDAGLGVRPWLVLTHSDEAQAMAEPRFATVDAWGNRSRYALCPSHPEVREFCRLLVTETVRVTGARELFIESLTAPGLLHSTSHDKIEHSALTPLDEVLLSLCCCSACGDEARRDDWDPAELSREVRAAFDGPELSERAEELFALVLATRTRVAGVLAGTLSAPIDGSPLELTIAASRDPTAFGAFAPLPEWPDAPVGLCADLSNTNGRGWRDLDSWASRGDGRLAGTLQVGSGSLQDALDRAKMPSGAAVALDELYLYHLGMRHPASLVDLQIHSTLTAQPQGNS